MPSNFKVTLSRQAGDIEQQAISVVVGSSKNAAGDLVFSRAKANPLSQEWLPVLADGIVADDGTIDVVSVEKTDAPPTQSGDVAQGAGDKKPGGEPLPSAQDARTQSGRVGVEDVKGLGTEGTRVRGDTGAIEHLTEGQLQAQRQGIEGDAAPKPRAKSDPALASAPGTGGVKAALNNPIPRPGDGGRLLDVNSQARDDDGREATIDVAEERQGIKPVPGASE